MTTKSKDDLRTQLETYLETKSTKLKAQIVERFMPMLRRIASTAVNSRGIKGRVDEYEFLSAAYRGFCNALDRLDPQRLSAFVAYASQKANFYILDEIRVAQRSRQTYNQQPQSLDTFCDDVEMDAQECLAQEINVTEQIEQDEELQKLLVDLNDRERAVITLRYRDNLLMHEIADKLEISESRISQLHAVALKKLKAQIPNSLDISIK